MKFKALNIDGLVAKYPIVQGGMGIGISLSNLAGHVALAGGVGVISTAQIGFKEEGFEEKPYETNLATIKKYIDKAREIAKGGVIGVNIMVATKHYEEYVKAAVKAGVDLIISGAGLPTNLPEFVKNTKTKIAPIVSSVKSAKVICKLWDRRYGKSPDMVVIEGPKAGGHLGFSKEDVENITDKEYEKEIVAIKEVVDEYSKKYDKHIPVVFGGGVYDKADMEHYMGLGIDGVQMGTRFVVAKESIVHENYKKKVLAAKDIDSEVTGMTHGHPVRQIRNNMTREYLKLEKAGAPFEELEHLTLGALRKAVVEGDVINGTLMAGQIAGLVKQEQTCAEMIQEIMEQAEKLLK